MSSSSRRVPPSLPNQHPQYAAVPQSPRSGVPYAQSSALSPAQHRPSIHPSVLPDNQVNNARSDTAQDVQTGAIGGAYGPYSYHPGSVRESGFRESRFSAAPSEVSSLAHEKGPATTTSVPAFLWDTKDPDLDDALHNPDPVKDAILDKSFTLWSARGWANVTVLILLVVGLVTLFAGYPIIAFYHRHVLQVPGFNLGGINGTGQVPSLPGLRKFIDTETPDSAKSRVGHDGFTYNLVFSDEFNADGRTFWPGDDPYWEAVDLHYWPTGDLEWYNPQAITTKDGNLVITITEQQNHDLNWQSGMLTTWNKWCFTTGYIEISVSLPGNGVTPGFWPAAWTMGNLGRAGYGATTEGMWPYTYDSCDVGTFPNQTDKSGNPAAALTGDGNGNPISFLPGQRLSKCTCPGSDHPGPTVDTGRGVPEIDIFEAQINTDLRRGEVSQSYQIAPYNYQYTYNNVTPATTRYDTSITRPNSYKGGQYQEALSSVTLINNANYGGNGFGVYGFEWWSDPNNRQDGFITWSSDGQPSWQITSASAGADPVTQVSQRLISEEPHYIIMNLGMSPGFQPADYQNLQFPSQMLVDYVRVYQREGTSNTGCNPKNRPTSQYINDHMVAYTNPNITTWDQANFTFPRNSLYDGC